MGFEMSLFMMVFGLQLFWSVMDVCFDVKCKEIYFEVCFKCGSWFVCLFCGVVDQLVYDMWSRMWEYLCFFEYKVFIYVLVFCVVCSVCGKIGQVLVSWVCSGSGFSQLFDVFVIILVREMLVKIIVDLFEVGDDWIWCVFDYYVFVVYVLEDFSDVIVVGIDEMVVWCGYNYIFLFYDFVVGRLFFVCEGCDVDIVKIFVEDFCVYGGDLDVVMVVCIDMSWVYIVGVGWYLLNVVIIFDWFYVIQLVNVVFEEVWWFEVCVEFVFKYS